MNRNFRWFIFLFLNSLLIVNCLGVDLTDTTTQVTRGTATIARETTAVPTTPGWETTTPSSACGGDFNSSEGHIYSPNYPNNYSSNEDCYYYIRRYDNYNIQLNVISFNLGHGYPNCSYDYIEISDIGSGNVIGTYCGNMSNIPDYINTKSYAVRIRFHSDDSDEFSGFAINYTRIGGCGGNFNTIDGNIYSPNYPNNYPPNKYCDYVIERYDYNNIQLHVLSFSLQLTYPCNSGDYMVISDYYDGHLIGEYCGTNIPEYINTNSDKILIRFHSNNILNQFSGFNIHYNREGCGEDFTTNEGNIYSPNYPNSYPPNKNCDYVIDRYDNRYIELNVIFFYLEDSYECSYDYIEISDSDSGHVIGKYCGNGHIPDYIDTNSYKVRIRFHSDNSNQFPGFHIYFKSKGCGGTFSDIQGNIYSPNFPNNYPLDENCDYVIERYGNFYIQLTVLSFHLEYTSGCTFDYIEISDYYSGHVIGKYCGTLSNIPEYIHTTSYKVRIRFYSDGSNQYSGFEIYYSREDPTTPTPGWLTTTVQGCGGTFNTFEGNIYSPNYPSNYPPNENCDYVIERYDNYYIQLTALSFNLEHTSGCIYDYIEISDYYSGLVIGKYCGTLNDIPEYINTNSCTVRIRFHSDDSNQYSGFNIHYSREGGGNVNTPDGHVYFIGQIIGLIATKLIFF